MVILNIIIISTIEIKYEIAKISKSLNFVNAYEINRKFPTPKQVFQTPMIKYLEFKF